jgi:DNA processing protein
MSAPDPAIRDHLALALVPGLGPKLTRAVLDHFGSPAAALRATASELEAIPQVGPVLARRFADAFRTADPSAEWDLIVRHGVRVVPLGHPDYPARLAAIPDPPPLLYLKGELTAADGRSVAVVGSRGCTAYGRRTAERIAAGLAAIGWTVVSGLARGIDGAAHRGALDAGGRTIAVLAGGLSSIYPPEHTDLAERVAGRGALLAETPMTVEPQPGMFPARNRIISGLCRAVVVVEANVKSGALITASHAADQGREVFAVPGNVDSPASAGCLELIRKGARLVRSADDILEDLRGIAPPDPPPARRLRTENSVSGIQDSDPVPTTAQPPPGLEAVQVRIWEALATARQADELARELGLPAGELSRHLTQMELRKAVRRLPGNQFERR